MDKYIPGRILGAPMILLIALYFLCISRLRSWR